MTIDNDDELRRILAASKVVATVGVSGNPDKPSYGIFAYLADHGYHMIPINPGTPEIQGLKTYADLSSVPEKIVPHAPSILTVRSYSSTRMTMLTEIYTARNM